MRRRRRWMEDLVAGATGILIFVIAFSAAIYVHMNARQWEALAIIVSFVFSLLPAIWYFRTKRRGWLMSFCSGVLLAFSFASALFHGWGAAATALVYVGIGAFMVFVIVALYRMNRAVNSVLRELEEEQSGNALFRGSALFRDDGERIMVYPNRRKVLAQCVFQLLLLAIIACILIFVPIHNVIALGALGLLAIVLPLVFLGTLIRLVVRRPTLVVGPDGILDYGSLMATGAGILRWEEILGVQPTTRSSGFVTTHYLGIFVLDGRAIRRRQPLWKRWALRVTISWSTIQIWQGLLDIPAGQLADKITRYVETHAPAGWSGWLGASDAKNGENAEDTDDSAQTEQ